MDYSDGDPLIFTGYAASPEKSRDNKSVYLRVSRIVDCSIGEPSNPFQLHPAPDNSGQSGDE